MAPAGGDDGPLIGVLSLSATQGARPKAPSLTPGGVRSKPPGDRDSSPQTSRRGDEMGGIGTLVLDVKILRGPKEGAPEIPQHNPALRPPRPQSGTRDRDLV